MTFAQEQIKINIILDKQSDATTLSREASWLPSTPYQHATMSSKLTGINVLSSPIPAKKILPFQLKGLMNGTYLVKITTDDGVIVNKVMKL